MKYFLAGLLFWTFSVATAQVMLPAYQGVFSKPVANVNSIITSGLVLNLDASNAASYPGSGTVWTDLSGSGNNGTIISGITYSNINGGSMIFSGAINNRVQTNFAPTFTDFTVCVWFKDNGSPQYGRLIDKDYVNGFHLQ